jgi:uncharacterized protein (DUF433 family)
MIKEGEFALCNINVKILNVVTVFTKNMTCNRCLILSFCCVLSFCIYGCASNENTNKQNSTQAQNDPIQNSKIVNDGQNFIKNRLRSPSSVVFISYKYGTEVKAMLEDFDEVTDTHLIDCITVGLFEYDAQNGFGATIREQSFVFYKNEKPCYLETVADLIETYSTLASSGIPQNFIPTVNTALNLNGCGCE